MCKSQGDLQRVVSPRAVCVYLYVRRYTGMRFFFSYPCAKYGTECSRRFETQTYRILKCNIVTFLRDELSILFVYLERSTASEVSVVLPFLTNKCLYVRPPQGHPTVPPPLHIFIRFFL